MKKFLLVSLIVVIGVYGFLGAKYYSYVTRGETPYDEIGISLAGIMLSPVRVWGCGKMKERFPKSLPPYGCTDAWQDRS